MALKVTIDITKIDDYREVDRIRVMADSINVVEEWLYAVAGEATIDVESPKPFAERRIVGTVEGTFNSLVSPYMYEVLDTKVAELKRIWTATIGCTVSES